MYCCHCQIEDFNKYKKISIGTWRKLITDEKKYVVEKYKQFTISIFLGTKLLKIMNISTVNFCQF